MRTRLIIGPIIVLTVLGLLFLDFQFFPELLPAMSGLITLLALVGWVEFSQMAGFGPKSPHANLSLRVLGGVAILYFHLATWYASVSSNAPSADSLLLIGVFGSVFLTFSLVVFRKDFLQHYRGVHQSVLAHLMFGVLFSYLIRIYHVPDVGVKLAVLFFLGVKGTDIFAYLVGRAIGKHRFLAVSPKKSAEGCVGALIWACLWFSLAPQWLVPDLFTWWEGVISGIIIGVAAQIGDYAESLIKREYQTKDSQSLLPEFGGVLDMIDSLVFPGFLFWSWVQLSL